MLCREVTLLANMINVIALPRARIPIVKFEHPTLRIKCDISINNQFVKCLAHVCLAAVYLASVSCFFR